MCLIVKKYFFSFLLSLSFVSIFTLEYFDDVELRGNRIYVDSFEKLFIYSLIGAVNINIFIVTPFLKKYSKDKLKCFKQVSEK